jgi:ParB/RepB/Spo0J family partition protein
MSRKKSATAEQLDTRPIEKREVLGEIVRLPLSQIKIEPSNNTRLHAFTETEIKEIADSIRAVGLLQPVVVRKDPDSDSYVLVAGFRRMAGLKMAEQTETLARVIEVPHKEALLANLAENEARMSLTPIEQAVAWCRLAREGVDPAQLASVSGKSKSHVENMLRLQKLTTELWVQFLDQKPVKMKEGGKESYLIMEYLSVAAKPENEQVAAWKVLESEGGFKAKKEKEKKEKKDKEAGEPTGVKIDSSIDEESDPILVDGSDQPTKEKKVLPSSVNVYDLMHKHGVVGSVTKEEHVELTDLLDSAGVAGYNEEWIQGCKDMLSHIVGEKQLPFYESGEVDGEG